MGLAERFWDKVHKTEGCWEWTAFRMRNGYGTIGVATRGSGKEFAHRVSWMLHNGEIPDGMFVCHRCDNPGCVRPDHLFLGTPADNMHDKMRKGRSYAPGAPGVRNTKAKLSEDGVRRMFDLARAGWLQARIAAEMGITQGTVSRALRGAGWTHLGIAPIRRFTKRRRAV